MGIKNFSGNEWQTVGFEAGVLFDMTLVTGHDGRVYLVVNGMQTADTFHQEFDVTDYIAALPTTTHD